MELVPSSCLRVVLVVRGGKCHFGIFHCQYVLLFLQRFHCTMYTVLLYISRVDHAHDVHHGWEQIITSCASFTIYIHIISHMVYMQLSWNSCYILSSGYMYIMMQSTNLCKTIC